MPPLRTTLATPAPSPEPRPIPAGDRAAVETVLERQSRAWGEGDAEAFAAAATPDVVFTNMLGMFGVGREAFAAHHDRIFSTNYKGSTLTQELVNLAFVRPDVAIASTVGEVRGFLALPPGISPIDGALRLRLEQVIVREEGAWRVAAFHNVAVNPVVLGPPPGVAPPGR